MSNLNGSGMVNRKTTAISRALIGKSISEAKDIAFQNNAEIKIIESTEESSIDMGKNRKNRVNVIVENGRITKVLE